MNPIHTLLLLYALVLPLSACAPKTLPPWQGEALTVQFSARVVPQASELPVQGAIRITQDGGTLGLILQHGRTLGQCRFEVLGNSAKPPARKLPDESPRESPHESPNELPNTWAGELRLQCRAAEGVGAAGQSLLQRVALAVYRSLPALVEQPLPAVPTRTAQPAKDAALPAQKWRVTAASSSVTAIAPSTSPPALQRFVYEDSLGTVAIVFSEVRRP